LTIEIYNEYVHASSASLELLSASKKASLKRGSLALLSSVTKLDVNIGVSTALRTWISEVLVGSTGPTLTKRAQLLH